MKQTIVLTAIVLALSCSAWAGIAANDHYSVRIGALHDQLQGHFTDVPIFLDSWDSAQGFNGFDLFIAYENTVLSFQMAYEGDLYSECEWEYFTYRFGSDGGCSGDCPSGLTRVVGMANINNGSHHPLCQTPDLPTSLAVMRFIVTNDRTWECRFVPIRFYWCDCGDNVLSSASTNWASVSHLVYDRDSVGSIRADDGTCGFPTYFGAQDSCVESASDVWGHPYERTVDFYNGGVQIVCVGDIDARGDINLNGISYELADVIMFCNYFLHGLAAFGAYYEGSIAASDVNADGVPLQFVDYVWMEALMGGAEWHDPPTDTAPAFSVSIRQDTVNQSIKLTAPEDSSGWFAHLVFDGELESLHWEEKTIRWDFSDGFSCAVILDPLPCGVTELSYTGQAVLVAAEAAHTDPGESSRRVAVTVAASGPPDALPTVFNLYLNYPNPFNPRTTITYDLPVASHVRIEVFNMAGQVVKTLFSQRMPAGQHQCVWDSRSDDGSRVSSGVYFYRITAGDYEQSRKMMLLK